MGALYKGLIITALASILLIYMVTDFFIGTDKLIINSDLFIESFLGIDLFIVPNRIISYRPYSMDN